jgi:tetratricopeptide (TPR) repeat protein
MLREREQKALVFISYAHQDKKLRDKLENHLTDLKYRGLITTWSDREIQAGDVSTQQIDIFLNKAHIILFLVSSDFIASNYFYSAEMKLAMERRERKEVEIIPILLRPVLYESAPFAKLQALPTNGKPVALWRNRDLAFVDIACGIAEIVQKRFPQSVLEYKVRKLEGNFEQENWVQHRNSILGLLLRDLSFLVLFIVGLVIPWNSKWTRRRRYYEEAIRAYQAALSRNPHDATAFRGMGNALYALKRFQEALNAFQQAIIHCDSAPAAYAGLGNTLTKLKRYSEAITAYEQAAALDSTVTLNQDGLIRALLALGRKEEVQQMRIRAKQSDNGKN